MPPESSLLLTSPGRLRKIDQLRDKNIGAYLPLPQLVAVGDQSSGKSSLLEGLSGIPFPRAQELCTRYATQITHRRETKHSIDITVIPGPHASQDHVKKLGSDSRNVQTTEQLRKEFPSILVEVNALMGIRTPTNLEGENTFSEDVLKIEKCGPHEDYLTVIDVPGIFRTTTEGVTTNKDKELVEEMVKQYIKDTRTIILAVLPCNVDVATQEILAMAEEVDPTGDRTLGILIKADLLKEQSAKAAVVSLVEGKKKVLKLGYHVVTNRGGDDDGEEADPLAAQRERETMFRDHPWCDLPDDRVGVSALRERLGDLLGGITDRAFPQLRTETRQRLGNAEIKLKELGVPRQTEREQQQYLVGIAGKFQALVRAALDADYSAHEAFDRNELRLITAVVNITETFNIDFTNHARTYLFTSEKPSPPAMGWPPPTPAPVKSDISKSQDGLNTALQLSEFKIPAPSQFPDLSRILVTDWRVEAPKMGIMKWIEAAHKRSRALDLGSFGHGILSSVFREQSAKWEIMTKQYLSTVILTVHQFILAALEAVCGDALVLQGISFAILDGLCDRFQGSMDQAELLIGIEHKLKPYTLNHYFNHTQQKTQGVRIQETLRPKAKQIPGSSFDNDEKNNRLVVDLDDIAVAVTNKSNIEHTKETIHDTLQAYYQVAEKRLVDNVFCQAVDYKLLSGPDSPLRLFSEQWVLELETDELLAIAGESRRNRELRVRLKKEIEDLEAAMKILL